LWPFRDRERVETLWIRRESRAWETVAADFFSWCLRIVWDLQGFGRNVQNDAAMITFRFRPKMQLGLRMRPSVIVAVNCNVAE
jgi:hypothetical protein